jgi:hypothetical protein
MQKIFHFDSLPEPYVGDAAVLCCFDERIRLQRAAELVKANFPLLAVRSFFVAFDGVHAADAHEIGQAA